MRLLHTTYINPAAGRMLVLYSIAECESSELLTCCDAPRDMRLPDCFPFAIALEHMDTAWHSAQHSILAPCYVAR